MRSQSRFEKGYVARDRFLVCYVHSYAGASNQETRNAPLTRPLKISPLILSPVAVNMAMGKTGDGSAVLFPAATALAISMLSLATPILVSLLGKGFLRLVPIRIVSVAIAPAIEPFGEVLAISSITGKKYLQEPAVHRWKGRGRLIEPIH